MSEQLKSLNKTGLVFLFVIISTFILNAQTNIWNEVSPSYFPTNVSGQINGISRVSQLKFHPTDPNKMYAISARGGLFMSTNSGNNWTVASGTDQMQSNRLASICIDYTNDQILYLGTGDHNYYYSGTGIWKSTNGGQTFSQIGLGGKLIFEIVMDPTDHNVLVAGTNAGIFKSLNGGVNWSVTSIATSFDDLKMKTPSSRVLFAATNRSEFYRSNDFGTTWTQITNGIVLPPGITNGNGCRIALTPADTNIVYFAMVANGGILYKSTDGATSFTGKKTAASPYLTYYTNSSSSSTQGDYNFAIGADRINANIIYLVAENVWKSTDGGGTWSQLTNWWQTVHTDMHQIIVSPYDNTKLYNMNDGGVWLSTNGGNNWTSKSDGISGYEIYHGNCSPTRRDMISIGTQDNGELYSTSSGWYTNRGGDWGSQCAFDFSNNSSEVYYYENTNRRQVNGGDVTYGLPSQVTSLQEISFHRSEPDLAFVAFNNIYRTTNLSSSSPGWIQILSSTKKVMAMHSSFADKNRLSFITSDGFFYQTINALDATPSFTNTTLPSVPSINGSITSIKASPNIFYVILNTRVYRTTDNGSTWKNITYNLPTVNHVKIIADEFSSSNELVFIASGSAVYYKTVSDTLWTLYNLALPTRTAISDLSFFNDGTANSLLRVATYGRGMWEIPVSNLRDTATSVASEHLLLTATPDHNLIHLKWTTANELKNTGFELQRSEDTVNFEKITWSKSLGTSVSNQNYFFDDPDVFENVVYNYRLKQIDSNALESYSNIAVAIITNTKDLKLDISGNPFHESSTISYYLPNDSYIKMILYDAVGKKIAVLKNDTEVKGEYTFIPDQTLTFLPQGIYFIELTSGSQRIIKKLMVLKN